MRGRYRTSERPMQSSFIVLHTRSLATAPFHIHRALNRCCCVHAAIVNSTVQPPSFKDAARDPSQLPSYHSRPTNEQPTLPDKTESGKGGDGARSWTRGGSRRAADSCGPVRATAPVEINRLRNSLAIPTQDAVACTQLAVAEVCGECGGGENSLKGRKCRSATFYNDCLD